MPTIALDLVPVRALNQVTYCPRLYFLEYVEGVMPTNEHVEDGLFQHRRVNDPDLQNKTRKDGGHKCGGNRERQHAPVNMQIEGKRNGQRQVD